MSIAVRCTSCSSTLNVADSHAGKKGRCPNCKTVVQIPAAMPKEVARAVVPAVAAAQVVTEVPAAATFDVTVTPAVEVSPLRSLASVDLRKAVLSGFGSAFQPIQASDAYRSGLLLSTAFMLMLPVAYLFLLMLPGLLVTVAIWLLMPPQAAMPWGVLAIMLCLLLCASLFLMVKPILFAEKSASRARKLTAQQEPLLFEFVYRICDMVRAPRPSQIEIDCDINASASFRRGWLSLFGNDFSLTLGVPLVAGLSLQQFAGVLAHEFGHFSQGSAMRMTFIIRSINAWMVQAVYERDRADGIIDAAIDSGTGLALLGLAAKLLLMVPRGIMWLLLRAGVYVVGNMLQQMEFDADRYESHLVGSDTFKQTCRQIRVVQIAWDGAQQDMSQYYRDGRLVDNLPRLIMENVSQIPAKVLKKAEELMAEDKTQWFDSHPSDVDRIASVEANPQRGGFRSHLPAVVLFAEFEKVAKGVSYDFYRALFGEEIDKKPLMPVDDLLARQAQEKITWEALDRYFLESFSGIRPLVIPRYDLDAPENPQFMVEQLNAARAHLLHYVVSYRTAYEQYLEAHKAGLEAMQARVLLRARLRLKPELFKNTFRNQDDVYRVDLFAREEQARLDTQLQPMETAAGVRLYAGLSLLFEPTIAARIEHAAFFQQEARTLLAVVGLVAKNWLPLLSLIGHEVTVDTLYSNRGNSEPTEQFSNLALEAFEGAHRSLIYFRSQFDVIDYPFDHVDGRMMVSHYLLRVVPMPRDYGGVAQATEDVLEGLQTMYSRSAARLCAIAELVEQQLGLEPLVDPAPPKKD